MSLISSEVMISIRFPVEKLNKKINYRIICIYQALSTTIINAQIIFSHKVYPSVILSHTGGEKPT
jgi:hypothetical protein